MAISVPTIDPLFSAIRDVSTRSTQSSETALAAGIDRYQKGDYEGSLREFRRSIALSPGSEKLVDTHIFMADAYLRMDRNREAEQTYRMAIKIQPTRADLHTKLGNLQFADGRSAEAEQSYRAAYTLDRSTQNGFSLGQAQLQQGNLAQAEAQFKEVISRAPKATAGYYGLGQVYAKQGNSAEAEKQFNAALAIDPKFMDAHADLGYLYIDNGDATKAAEQVEILRTNGSDSLADTLDGYISTATKPKMLFALSANFPVTEAGSQPLAAIDSYLEVASSKRQYSMQVFFDKQMDTNSVLNRSNWEIGRSSGTLMSEQYNLAMPIPGSEIQLTPLPDTIVYDDQRWMATVYFTVKQNSAANATLDPAHLEFRFNGQDIYGNAMDSSADQFAGMTGVR